METLAGRAARAGSPSQLLASMSHELRPPLNAVIGFSEALMRGGNPPVSVEQVRDFAGSINGAGRQMLALIDVILDVAHVDGAEFELPSDLIDVSHLINSAAAQAEASAAAGDLLLRGEAGSGLPLLRGDERRLKQALNHLIANGIASTAAGGSVLVSARLEEDGGDLMILVRDTGGGIAPDDAGRVFEPFLQPDSGAEHRFSGSGLGLYVAQATARAHSGALLLRRHGGAGTTAVFRLPAWRLVAQSILLPSSQDHL